MREHPSAANLDLWADRIRKAGFEQSAEVKSRALAHAANALKYIDIKPDINQAAEDAVVASYNFASELPRHLDSEHNKLIEQRREEALLAIDSLRRLILAEPLSLSARNFDLG